MRFHVSVYLDSSRGGRSLRDWENVIEITRSTRGISHVDYAGAQTGEWKLRDVLQPGVAAHEFGHLLGFVDRYREHWDIAQHISAPDAG